MSMSYLTNVFIDLEWHIVNASTSCGNKINQRGCSGKRAYVVIEDNDVETCTVLNVGSHAVVGNVILVSKERLLLKKTPHGIYSTITGLSKWLSFPIKQKRTTVLIATLGQKSKQTHLHGCHPGCRDACSWKTCRNARVTIGHDASRMVFCPQLSTNIYTIRCWWSKFSQYKSVKRRNCHRDHL